MLIVADARRLPLRDRSVQAVVTSPPYWGLRDYGITPRVWGPVDCPHEWGSTVAVNATNHTDKRRWNHTRNGRDEEQPTEKRVAWLRTAVDQGAFCGLCGAWRGNLGLEPTPELYTKHIVEVFREVRRVLKDDGTAWLNLAASYFGGGNGGGGSFATERPCWSVFGGNGPIQSRQSSHAPAYGIDGRALEDSLAIDSACSGLCDECRVVLSNRSHTIRPQQSILSLSDPTTLALPSDCAVGLQGALLLDAPASTSVESSVPPLAACSHCANCGACLSVLRSSTRDAHLCARRAVNRNGNASPASAGRNQGTDASGMAWFNYTFKPKDMVPIPWMVAMALQADGWYLRSDIIWSKPNPMPESVTDRPTKAHEYLFLLSKSERYYYDADAIKEPITADSADRYEYAFGGAKNEHLLAEEATTASCRTRMIGRRTLRKSEAEGTNGRNVQTTNSEAERRDQVGSFNNNPRHRPDVGRNKRTVWTIPTMPYSGAHFATFPEALVEPCILSGCPVGGLVCDPFVGSGTVGAVAERLGRRWVGTDLAYQELAQARTAQRGIRFGDSTIVPKGLR